MKNENKYPLDGKITKIQRPKTAKQNEAPKLLASIPKKEGESTEDFVNRFLEKLANLPTKPSNDQ